jgi:nucleotide-binding universal stress UspA family protein
MYTNLIVAVDGRQGGRDAAGLGGLLASPDASRSLVFVTDARITRAPGLTLEFAADDDLRELLVVERRLCAGDPHIRRVHAPSVGVGLNEIAGAAGADLVVVDTSRRHGITSLFSGGDMRSVRTRPPARWQWRRPSMPAAHVRSDASGWPAMSSCLEREHRHPRSNRTVRPGRAAALPRVGWPVPACRR